MFHLFLQAIGAHMFLKLLLLTLNARRSIGIWEDIAYSTINYEYWRSR